ncbi:MAG: hypothetical protein IJV33_07170 [Bacteroidaceae bacterium]|nr:hypothetical protein [Bacteroidaceae bacterium]
MAMLNIYILRTSGNKDGTWGKLWTDGHPTFRCKTKEAPLQRYTGKHRQQCALPDGEYNARVVAMPLRDRVMNTVTVDKTGFFGGAALVSGTTLANARAGSVLLDSDGTDLQLAMSEYIVTLVANGILSGTKVKRGEVVLHFMTDKDFDYQDWSADDTKQRQNFDFLDELDDIDYLGIVPRK